MFSIVWEKIGSILFLFNNQACAIARPWADLGGDDELTERRIDFFRGACPACLAFLRLLVFLLKIVFSIDYVQGT
ncbi:hypothetical protein Nepgr_007179 [Nepenthes gracilis]|uniref:Uncharacterized protein n=1 Tax=Nepenthes gracilis TaxID=150966 RepID=A0AAD3XI42_NEPGR|nr:hypothetical protein Nepgr_007179 [Nepenthes gracilis]